MEVSLRNGYAITALKRLISAYELERFIVISICWLFQITFFKLICASVWCFNRTVWTVEWSPWVYHVLISIRSFRPKIDLKIS